MIEIQRTIITLLGGVFPSEPEDEIIGVVQTCIIDQVRNRIKPRCNLIGRSGNRGQVGKIGHESFNSPFVVPVIGISIQCSLQGL